jgi:hypothetical protein
MMVLHQGHLLFEKAHLIKNHTAPTMNARTTVIMENMLSFIKTPPLL